MTHEQLEAFLAVAEERRVTAAAKRLGTSQPALSRQLQALERELGARLIVRGARGAVLTDAGERFLVHARRALDSLKAGRAALDELASEPHGAVALGTLPTVGAYVLPDVLAGFHRNYPEVVVRLDEGRQDALEKRVADGRLDLAILDLPVKHLDLVAQTLWSESYVLCVPRGHRLARAKRPVALGDVVGEPLIVLPNARGTLALEAACEERGAKLAAVIEAPNPETVRRMVERGCGLALLPSIIARSEGHGFEVVPIGAGAMQRQVALLHRGDDYLTSAARALKKELVDALATSRRRS